MEQVGCNLFVSTKRVVLRRFIVQERNGGYVFRLSFDCGHFL